MSSHRELPEPGLPFPWRQIEQVARSIGIGRWTSAFRLEPELLLRKARRETGLDDLGSDDFKEPYELFLTSAQEDADLNLLGRRGIHGLALTLLTNRLLLHELLEQKSAIRRTRLKDPIFILGLPRSGSTFLHRMLAENRKLRALPYWRLSRPLPPRGRDDRREETERSLAIRKRLTPELDRKHYIDTDSVEECIWLLNSTFVSQGLCVAAPVWSYAEWMNSAESISARSRAYEEYRRYLQLFQWEDKRRLLLLKAPFHTGSLEILQRLFPQARFIQTHRAPLEVCPSLASLFYSTYRPVVHSLDAERLGRIVVETIRVELERNLEARNSIEEGVFDLPYSRLTGAPVETLEELYSFLGLEWDDEARRRAQGYLQENPPHKHGEHRYDLSRFGLDRKELEAAFRFYTDRFQAEAAPEG